VGIVDLIYPKKCVGCQRKGRYFCWECLRQVRLKTGWICSECNRIGVRGAVHLGCKRKYSLDGLVSLLSYKGLVRLGIHRLKYDFLKDVETELLEILGESLKIKLKDKREVGLINFLKKKPIVVPVPLYWRRENWRGFNQAEIVGKMLVNLLGLEMKKILVRRRLTSPQIKLDKKAREKNVKRVFEIERGILVPERVLLVDDVWTTGATMRAGGRSLKKAGVKEVWGLSLAR